MDRDEMIERGARAIREMDAFLGGWFPTMATDEYAATLAAAVVDAGITPDDEEQVGWLATNGSLHRSRDAYPGDVPVYVKRHPSRRTRTRGDVMPSPAPGSREALAAGCLCPRLDNCNGKFPPYGTDPETGEGRWIVVQGCPLHDGAVR